MKVGGIVEIQLISFLASALDVGELHVPERESPIPTEKEAGWAHTAALDVLKKRKMSCPCHMLVTGL
jgi:hypothetical protein